MNNQNSEKENPSTIYFSPTGDNLPPIDEKDMVKGSDIGRVIGANEENSKLLAPLQSALMEYALTLPAGEMKDKTIKVIQKLSIPLQDSSGKFMHRYVPIINIIPQKIKAQQCTGTMEYNEVQEEDIATKAMKDFLAAKNNSMVNHPKHYNTDSPIITIKCKCGEVIKRAIECIDVIREMPSWKGNTIKYLWRCGLKKEEGMSAVDKEIQDLEKAIWYIKDRINQLKEDKICK